MRTKLKRALYARTLQRAADELGGVDQLSELLKVRSQFITMWIDGKGIPPRDLFLQAVDLLSPESPDGRRRKSRPSE